ncbi:Heterokaryon incompatibility protein 6, OR allele [Cytospora mali]|uniref:Heterokaryon incompatibility protein 6, OR allele n=1 Tax=Cytospora mali TaxID=578113 RepID=A0A194UM12_CYTMA|nr:Heterokaryon incompatibility protein 6, OR allele [Valsa mali var. pyri (nom. inval.)]
MSDVPPGSFGGGQNAAEHDADNFLERLEAEMRTQFFSHEAIAGSPQRLMNLPLRELEATASLLETVQATQDMIEQNVTEVPDTVLLMTSMVRALRTMPEFGSIPGIARHIDFALSVTPSLFEKPITRTLPDLAQCSSFQYKPLKSPSSIRLVRFGNATDNDNTITLLLEVVDLNAAPTFKTLSYVWGDHRAPLNQKYHRKRAERRFPVLWDGARIEVTHNLYCFLRRISSATDGPLKNIRDTPIWIDQLCINQGDIAEKNVQVALMDRIYAQAEEVVSWLGEKDGQIDAAIQLLERLGSWPRNDDEPGPAAAAHLVRAIPDDGWQALAGLLSRPYFKRAWIVQEVALARRLLVLCGDHVIDWEDLAATSNLLEESRAWAMLSQHAKVFQSDEDQANPRSARSSTRFGGQLAALLGAQSTIRGENSSPERLLLLGRQFDATVIVDKFFAMLGIARWSTITQQDQGQDLPHVDYSQNLKEVSIDFAGYHMTKLNNLSLFAMVEDSAHRTDLAEDFPSWLPDPSAPLLPLPLEADALGVNRNVLFNCWGPDPPPYGPHVVFRGECLVLQGRRIDMVGPIAESFNNIVKDDEWFHIFDFVTHVSASSNLDLSDINLGEALWRTMAASPDSSSGGSSPTVNLDQEFGNWCISILDALENPNRHLLDDVNKYILAKMYSLDDLMFDVQTFGKDAEDTVNSQPRAIEEVPEFFSSIAEADKKRDDEDRRARLVKLTERLYGSLRHLWEMNPDDVFPSPERIASTLRALDTVTPQADDTHKRRREIQDGIDRFEAAVGIKIDSRRLFITGHHRLGMGPQSLTSGDEIWFVHGADVPLILRKVEDRGIFQLIGEAFVLGIMHGEAVHGPKRCLSTDVELYVA